MNASLILLTKENSVEAVVSRTDFTDVNGNVLAASNINANFQKYISTYMGSNWIPLDPRPFEPGPPPEGNRKDYPDVIYGLRMTINEQSVQAIWVEINVAKDTKAGEYTGFITVESSDGEGMQVKLRIEVLDLVLEETQDTDSNDYYLNLWQYPHAAEYYDVDVFSSEHLTIMKNQMKPYMDAGGRVGTASIVEEPWYHQTYYDYTSMVRGKRNNSTWEFDFTDFNIWVDFLFNDIGVSYVEAYTIVPWGNQIKYTEDGEEKKVGLTK